MTPYPWSLKLNPLWWFGNADDPVDGLDDDGQTPRHAGFYPDKPLWFRKLMWGLRNPLHNFHSFVIGLEDRPELVNYAGQWPKPGQKWNLHLPFICYQGTSWEWYAGWRNGRNLGFAFRRANSKTM